MIFVVPGIPQGKARARTVMQGGRVHSFTPAKTASYERLVAVAYQSAFPGQEVAQGGVELTVRAYFPVPKSWPLKRRQQALAGMIPVTVKPDCDNILKVIADALNGIAWQDDKQIIFAQVVKQYSIEPRVEVEIWQA